MTPAAEETPAEEAPVENEEPKAEVTDEAPAAEEVLQRQRKKIPQSDT